MFCPVCGREVNDQTKFCPSCGADLSAVRNQSATGADAQNTGAPGQGADAYDQGTYNQGTYNQGAYNQGAYNQGAYNQGGMQGAPGGFTVITDPFKATVARIASSSLFMAFLVSFTVLVATSIFSLITVSSTTGGVYMSFNFIPLLTILFGIFTLIPLYKLRGFAKGKNGGVGAFRNMSSYPKFQKVMMWIAIVGLIIGIIALAIAAAAISAPASQEALGKIRLEPGLTFKESFGDVLDENALDTVTKQVGNLDDSWKLATDALFNAAEQTGIDITKNLAAVITGVVIAALVGVIFALIFIIFMVVYYSKLIKFVKYASNSWDTGVYFTYKVGFIKVFSMILGIFYAITAATRLFNNPFSAIPTTANAVVCITLSLVIGSFVKELTKSYAAAADIAARNANGDYGSYGDGFNGGYGTVNGYGTGYNANSGYNNVPFTVNPTPPQYTGSSDGTGSTPTEQPPQNDPTSSNPPTDNPPADGGI